MPAENFSKYNFEDKNDEAVKRAVTNAGSKAHSMSSTTDEYLQSQYSDISNSKKNSGHGFSKGNQV